MGKENLLLTTLGKDAERACRAATTEPRTAAIEQAFRDGDLDRAEELCARPLARDTSVVVIPRERASVSAS